MYPLSTTTEIRELAELADLIQLQGRDINAEDEIVWQWTPNGEYSIQSAYNAQFIGHTKVTTFHLVWKAMAEPKWRIFTWILLQKKILTADNLEKMGRPHNPICTLCNREPETPTHLCKECDYTKETWDKLRTWLGGANLPPTSVASTLNEWWKRCQSLTSKTNPERIALSSIFGGIFERRGFQPNN